MKRSISVRITVYLISFSLLLIGIIALAVRFALPEYYMNRQMAMIEAASIQVHNEYRADEPEVVIPILESLKASVGGELYYYSPTGNNSVGRGQGQGRNSYRNSNSEKFIPTGNVTDYLYTNKVGLEIYAMGIAIGDEYLVYEVSVQNLDSAVGAIFDFFWILLLVVVLVAMVIAIFISRNMSKPIKALNELATTMKSKKVSAVMVTDNPDEIGDLNRSLNELYEELLSSIYQLETELQRERNTENLKKRFLAQATHELKTPIAVIRGYAEILYDGIYKDEEDRDRYLKNIYDESEAISRLILDVLDYTKMETGNYKLEKVEVSAYSYFSGTVSRFEDYINQAGKEARIHIDLPGDMTISLDKNRIEQVLRNLISNAVEHSVGWVEVKVDAPGDKIRICVSNDGEEIAQEDLPYLFDGFYKKKGKKKGTGLGLAIVKEIITLHYGDYRVENTGNGVRFVVSV